MSQAINFEAMWKLPKAQQAELYAKMTKAQQLAYKEALRNKKAQSQKPNNATNATKKRKRARTRNRQDTNAQTEVNPKESVREREIKQIGRVRAIKKEIEHNTKLGLVDIKADAKLSITQTISEAILKYKGDTIEQHHTKKGLEKAVEIRYKEGLKSAKNREYNQQKLAELQMPIDELIAKKKREEAEKKELKRIFWNNVKNVLTLGGVTRKRGRIARMELQDKQEYELRGEIK